MCAPQVVELVASAVGKRDNVVGALAAEPSAEMAAATVPRNHVSDDPLSATATEPFAPWRLNEDELAFAPDDLGGRLTRRTLPAGRSTIENVCGSRASATPPSPRSG